MKKKYFRTGDNVVTSDVLTHELTEDITDAGYYRKLKKGSLVRIGETWCNFYGEWTTLIDEDGVHYDIRPRYVERVTKELRSSYNLEDLFDEQIVEYKDKSGKVIKREFVNHIYEGEIPEGEPEYYGAIRTEMGLHYVAKKIEGEWRLI